MHLLDGIEWNCYTASPDRSVLDQLQEWVEEFEPDVFWLSEAAKHADVLPGLKGYDVLQEKPPPHAPRGDDTGDTAILVHHRHGLRRSRVAVMRKWWRVLRYNQRHEPHRYQQGVAKVRGQVWRLQAIHPPTHGFDGPNAEAFLETMRRTRRWMLLGLHRPSVSAGDQNATMEALGEWFGKRFKVFGKGIDSAVTYRVKVGTCSVLPTPVGDHDGRRFRLYY